MALVDVPIVLIEACARGDRGAMDRLLHRIGPDIYRIVFSMLRDPDETDEVVQETFIRLFRYIHQLKDPQRFASWAMRIAVNQVQTWRMKRGRQRIVPVEEMPEPEEGVVVISGRPADSPRQAAEMGEIRADIEAAIARLPQRQQAALTLFELEGCTIREIAEIMGCSEGAVKFNIHEARKKLKRSLKHWMPSTSGATGEEDPARVVNGPGKG